ncbi:MAG: hypothetical protein ACP5T5_06050 [Thermoprotei archaeon]
MKTLAILFLFIFADQEDAREPLNRANEGVKGKVSVKAEDQVAMIIGYDDKRKLVLGFCFVRYAASHILAGECLKRIHQRPCAQRTQPAGAQAALR